MTTGLSFELRYVDKMTGPAKQMARATGSLSMEAQRLSKQMKALNTGSMSGVEKVAEKLSKESKQAIKESQKREREIAKNASKEEKALQKQKEKFKRDALKALEKEEKSKEREMLARQKNAAKEQARLAKRSPLQVAEDQLKHVQNMDPKPIQLSNRQLEQYKGFLRDAKLRLDGLTASKRQLAQADVVDLAALARVNKEIQTQKNRLGEIQRVLILSGNSGKFGREGTNRLVTTLKELAEASGSRGIGTIAAKAQQGTEKVRQFTGAFKATSAEVSKVAGVSQAAGIAITGIGVAATAAVVGTVALTAAVAALGAGLSFVTAKAALFGIRQSEGRQATLGMLEAMLGSAKAAQVAKLDMDNLLRDFDTSPERVASLNKALVVAGMRGTQTLRNAMQAVVKTESVLGAEAANKLQGLFEEAAKPKFVGTFGGMDGIQRMVINVKTLEGTGLRLREVWSELAKRSGQSFEEVARYMMMGFGVETKKAVEAVGAVVEKKFGKQALQAALKFDVQMARLRQNVGRLFSGLEPSPFTKALKGIVDLFDNTTVQGAAMKGMINEFFNGLYRVAEKAIPKIRLALKGLVLVGLEVYIGFRPLLQQLGIVGEVGEESGAKLITFEDTILRIGEKAGKTAAKISDMANQVLKIIKFFSGEGEGGSQADTMFENKRNALRQKMGLSAESGMKSTVPKMTGGMWAAAIAFPPLLPVLAGRQVIDGLITGIRGKKSSLGEAITDVALGALKVFTDIFQIRSPSKVTEGMGKNLSLGMARGIQRGAPVANDNMAKMIDVRTLRSSGGANPQSASVSKGGITVNLNIENINLQGGSASEVMEDFEFKMEELLTNAIEKAVAMNGLRETG